MDPIAQITRHVTAVWTCLVNRQGWREKLCNANATLRPQSLHGDQAHMACAFGVYIKNSLQACCIFRWDEFKQSSSQIALLHLIEMRLIETLGLAGISPPPPRKPLSRGEERLGRMLILATDFKFDPSLYKPTLTTSPEHFLDPPDWLMPVANHYARLFRAAYDHDPVTRKALNALDPPLTHRVKDFCPRFVGGPFHNQFITVSQARPQLVLAKPIEHHATLDYSNTFESPSPSEPSFETARYALQRLSSPFGGSFYEYHLVS